MFDLLIPPAGVEVHGKFLMRKCDHLGSFIKTCVNFQEVEGKNQMKGAGGEMQILEVN